MAKLELTEHKNCQPNDCEVANHLASSALAELDAMDRHERQRLEQRVVDSLKQGFDNMLGGNWNVILGKEVQITVGLARFQRLLRFKHGEYRLFCFETYTEVKNMVEPPIPDIPVDQPATKAGKSANGSAEASPKAGKLTSQLSSAHNPSTPKPKADPAIPGGSSGTKIPQTGTSGGSNLVGVQGPAKPPAK